ncbi:MAG: ABC transporter permease [Treponema sp.]
MKESGFYGIVVNEFRHIFRDPQTLAILFLLPLVQIILFGYAMSTEIKSVPLEITDLDNSTASRALIRQFEGSSFFRLIPDAAGTSAGSLFQEERALAVITIQNGFARNLERTGRAGVDVIVDGSDGSRAQAVSQYITAVIRQYSATVRGNAVLFPVSLVPEYRYNPGLDSAYFFIPGLTALIIIMVSALLTSLTITGEKENGTFELIKLSPVKAEDVILGKVIPYLILSFIIGIFIVVCGRILFGVPVRGSVFLLGCFLLIYCLTGLSFGILISTLVNSRLSAMMLALLGTMMPTIFLSGFIFQLDSMPLLLRAFSWLVPAKYFLIIIRGIMLKGNTVGELRFYAAALCLFSILFLGLAIIRFRAYLIR